MLLLWRLDLRTESFLPIWHEPDTNLQRTQTYGYLLISKTLTDRSVRLV